MQQLYNNIKTEEKSLQLKNGFSEKNQVIKSYITNDFIFSIKTPDNCCYIKPDIPFKITAFDKQQNLVVGNRLLNKSNFFTDPFDSMETLGICLVDSNPSEEEEQFHINDIDNKLLCLPYEDKVLLVPMLHGCF